MESDKQVNFGSAKGESCAESDGIWHETSLLHQNVLKYVAYKDFFVKKWKDDHTMMGRLRPIMTA